MKKALNALAAAAVIASCSSAAQAQLRVPPRPALPRLVRKSVTATSGSSTPAPWQMSDDERIAGRTRNQSAQAPTPNASSAVAQRYAEHVHGREHPEFFLRVELFDRLLGAFSTDPKQRANAHALYDARIERFGYDSAEQFWSVVEWAARPYLDLQRSRGPRAAILSRGGKKILVPIGQSQCSARFYALSAAESAFGRTDFDRLLYVVVAPQAEHSFTGTMSAADRAEVLHYIAGGCR